MEEKKLIKERRGERGGNKNEQEERMRIEKLKIQREKVNTKDS